jgi:8-oxo-dGTP pyrophosphatase MutT (NUDIX family)
MNFQDFLQFVPQFISAELPAIDAHVKMAPLERIISKPNSADSQSTRTAAVLMLCYPKNGKTHLVLIVRNEYKGVHSAQIAFPGGKYEEEDLDFSVTALRETYEEIGIHPSQVEIIKPYTQVYIPPSNFVVHPFFGLCRDEIRFIPDPSEVAQIIELPISTLLNDSIVVETEIPTSESTSIVLPAFKFENHIVWGATAMMLSELKEVLKVTLEAKL